MSRIVVRKGDQKGFLEKVEAETGLSWEEIAKLCGICGRSLCDWRREKNKMTLEAAERLTENTHIPLLNVIEILPEHWSVEKAAKAGGKAHAELYGSPGTIEGRRKGGLHSQALRKAYPERYRHAVQRKKIITPQLSPVLAEFVGIILGDGGITQYQTAVSFNSSTDAEYIKYVSALFQTLFGLSTSIKYREGNACSLRASSIELSKYLVFIGLHQGNKVRNQVDVPQWIFNKRKFMGACIRGLIDTDGNIARKNYHAKTLAMQISFRNESQPLLRSAREMLIQLGFTPSKITKSHHIHLTRKKDIEKYMREIGFNNPKHLMRYNNICERFGRSAREAEGSRLLSD